MAETTDPLATSNIIETFARADLLSGSRYGGEPIAVCVRSIVAGELERHKAHLEQKRDEFVQALKASPRADADYWRWQGHAEDLRQEIAVLDNRIAEVLHG